MTTLSKLPPFFPATISWKFLRFREYFLCFHTFSELAKCVCWRKMMFSGFLHTISHCQYLLRFIFEIHFEQFSVRQTQDLMFHPSISLALYSFCEHCKKYKYSRSMQNWTVQSCHRHILKHIGLYYKFA